MNIKSYLHLLTLSLFMVSGCDDYSDWPAAGTFFPHVYTAETGLKDYEKVRWETETWTPDDIQTAALYVAKLALHRKGAPQESLEHFARMRQQIPPLDQGIRLSFVGDVMWVKGNWKDFAKPAGVLLDGDLRVGNLETPTSKDHSTKERALGLYSFNAPVTMLEGLPLDLLQLNNNHILDAADLGLENTVREVRSHGFQQVGVDAQAMVDIKGRRIAFLAYTWGINDKKRSSKGHQLHIIPFGHLDEEIPLDLLSRQATEARAAGAETVVVLAHWGFEYEYYPDPHIMVLGRRMIQAGADLVVGQGPHVAQPVEFCHVNHPQQVPGEGTCSVRTEDGKPRMAAIIYSLGNFGTTMPPTACKSGLVVTVSLDQEVTGLGWSGAFSQDIPGQEGQTVVPLSTLTLQPVLAAEEARLEQHLGKGWKR